MQKQKKIKIQKYYLIAIHSFIPPLNKSLVQIYYV